ncbi:MAG: hypothetical protein HS113_01615 [Verrucomicrobiales bacterium]|nr:hypothetical protein [Verrucomicrobiales bacterium]
MKRLQSWLPAAVLEAVRGDRKRGIHSYSYVFPDTGHKWHSWWHGLHQFAPFFFREPGN